MTELSRRHLLSRLLPRLAGAGEKTWWAEAGDRGAVAEVGLTPARTAQKSASTGRHVLVTVLLYGGFDGLTAVPPLGDPHYRPARPTIAVPRSTAISLDGFFALHPELSPLVPFWHSRTLAVVPAAGIPFPTMSHFQAQQDLGQGAPGTSLASGWMNRALGALGESDALAAVQVGSSVLTPSLVGSAPVTTLWEVSNFSLIGESWSPSLPGTLRSLYGGVHSSTRVTALDTLSACAGLSGLQHTVYRPANGASYPDSALGGSLEGVAQLIKADVGVRLAAVEYGDWDFHADLGSGPGGAMSLMLADLGRSLAAFARDLGPELERVTVVTMSEFGRRIEENGSRGVDHGHGNAMLVLGGVRGGRVYGRWPGLAPRSLDEGNLAGTTDYRDVLAEILIRRCGLASVARVFPRFRPHLLGLV